MYGCAKKHVFAHLYFFTKKVFMWRNKWIYIIGIDIILGIVLFSAGYFQELAFLFFTFYAMCASGILGILFLFFKRIRNIGYALLINLLILPFLFMAILFFGPDWQILGIDYDSDDIVYDINHKGYKYELVMHGEEYNKVHWAIDSVLYKNRFDINPINKVSSQIRIYGNYNQIGTNRYMLIRRIPGYEDYSYQREHGTFLIKDTLLLSNDTLYGFYREPVLARKRN